ncbi:hypothetical protein BLL42_19380 [Pseudomonas frederiksbergensis]|uniref:Uncharacterized protein n=1 Tax=Pseudomonas frederiksbergensis TaxID=104087 RepID=A0A1J0ENT1_9PSED|nr:hypothetical protein [Pseudomonas frederiksbergensis]APC17786.1 hypothetical protein BLL42_19380 [Pseudomonas frederiksbergensis]
MKKTQKKISNPMTIIAIFATLSETSAALSLPFLDNEERQTYIWFLISFPFYLLFLFFITLNLNYKSLYAPSDFQKSKQFVKVIDDAARPQKNRNTATNDSVEEDNQPISIKGGKPDYLLQSAPAPPAYITLIANLSSQHQVSLPASISIYGMQIIDTRWIRKKKDFDSLMSTLYLRKHHHRDMIIFLTSDESEHLINERALKKSDAKAKESKESKESFYMIYNLSTLAMTVVSQH